MAMAWLATGWSRDGQGRVLLRWLSPLSLGLAALLGAGPLQASSPEAWKRYDRQVRSACVAASGLAAVRIRGSRIDFPSLGLSSLVLEGTYPQAHMAGRRGLELCVFEQRSGRAAVAEADAQLAAPGSTPAAAPGPAPR
jgi:hypothetical protein